MMTVTALAAKKNLYQTVNENQITDLMAAMDETTTIKDLWEAHKLAYAAANGETAWQKKVIARKDAKKSTAGG
jgi:hypothetical protein